MPRLESTSSRLALLLGAASLAAHSISPDQGFRQKDVRFFFDLFSNWVEICFVGGVARIQNIQIVRFLSELEGAGCVKRARDRTRPRYKLTRMGLLEVLGRIVNTEIIHREQFFFLFYFVKNYRARLIDLVQREGSQFPPSLRIELDALLDSRALVEREKERTKREIDKLVLRMRDAEATSELTRVRLKQKVALADIVAEAERKYPYELNSQKPLHSLIESIPADQRQWELETGNHRRSIEVWAPARKLLDAYLVALNSLPLESSG